MKIQMFRRLHISCIWHPSPLIKPKQIIKIRCNPKFGISYSSPKVGLKTYWESGARVGDFVQLKNCNVGLFLRLTFSYTGQWNSIFPKNSRLLLMTYAML